MSADEQYVEQYARAHLVTGAADGHRAVPVVLRYGGDGQVRVALPAPEGEWTFPRELLERGLRAPVTGGDIRIWPCGRVQAVIEFHAREGVAVVQFDVKALIRFLRRTYTAATPVTSTG
ncbi:MULTISPECIES: SsgA family sporulation/cell division regulator [unclassified Streptomyces]|uniref:SsgA family sporulation/cell division regulator n=1 Tax=unclassified Streptomyces TaxID=2593676 RepID=UPI000DB98ADC|nr:MULTISPECIES: SsgA family sporulation/cell division regulator [unclassified Streptomyces]MYT72684.1 SsgA family sporulation/cell division regulator [Streptomyces sp. SID8367]RAJ79541.1 sporulation and cell division protein SsgA [Streptomyces sp. PsTaAH-137]